MITKYEFRDIRPDEFMQAAKIEQICFPPNEACTEKNMKLRVAESHESIRNFSGGSR